MEKSYDYYAIMHEAMERSAEEHNQILALLGYLVVEGVLLDKEVTISRDSMEKYQNSEPKLVLEVTETDITVSVEFPSE